MKVLMIDSLVGNDYSLAMCAGLVTQGVDVQLVVPRDRVVETDIAFPVIQLAPSKSPGTSKIRKTFQYIKYLFRLLLLIRRNNVQLVHFQFFRRERLDTFFVGALRLLSMPIVYTAHNVLPHENGRIDYYLRYLVYKVVDGIIVHSEYIQRKLLNAFKVDPAKTAVIPHGNFDLYLPDEELSKEESRNKLGLKKEDRVLLFFGYIRAYKGLDLLIEAFESASAVDKRLKLLIAGAPQSPQLDEQYAGQISKITAHERILFHSHFIPFKDVAFYFTAADLVILPYKTIDHSGIVHLAYTFGKPVIGTPVGDFAEVIDHGKSGYILENHDADCLAEGIRTAFCDEAYLEQMGHFAQELNKTKYSWIHIARRTKLYYEKVISRQTHRMSESEEAAAV